MTQTNEMVRFTFKLSKQLNQSISQFIEEHECLYGFKISRQQAITMLITDGLRYNFPEIEDTEIDF
jgi:hypothetical protein